MPLFLLPLILMFNNCGGFDSSEKSYSSGNEGDIPPATGEPMPPLPVPPATMCPTLPTGRILYVNSTRGSDATTYAANSATNPWRTIGRAARGAADGTTPISNQAAQAGDTVIIQSGTYTTVGTNSRYIPAYNPINSGTPGNPITYQAESNVILTFSSGIGPVIGTNQRNYITWRGFTLDEALAPSAGDTGPVVLWDAVGGVIENCDIDGNGVGWPGGRGELKNGVRIAGGGGHTVRNNYIHDYHNDGSGSNASAILIDHSAGGLIEHNNIANSDGVIFIKRNYNAPGRWIFRYNYGHDSVMGIRADQLTITTQDPSHSVEIYQNLLVNISADAFMTHYYENRSTSYLHIVNNTVKNCDAAFEGSTLTANAGHIFHNNIITNCAVGFRTGDYSNAWNAATFTAKHNLYRNLTNAFTFRWEMAGQSTLSFAAWQGLGQDIIAPTSQLADPMFVNEAGGNFRLQESSPARNAGIDYLDLNNNGGTGDPVNLGAYITGTEIIGNYSCP